MSNEAKHISVLLNECIENLNIKPDGIYVDGTLGLGGHSEQILKRLDTGRLIGIDRDESAIRRTGERLAKYADKMNTCARKLLQTFHRSSTNSELTPLTGAV